MPLDTRSRQVKAAEFSMRYRLLQRAPCLVQALRVVYEVVSICFEAAHELVLFR